METDQALAFLAFAVVAAITPGPSNTMLTVAGAMAGVVRGLPCLAGIASGMAVLMFVCAAGLGTLVSTHQTLLAALKWCGTLLLLWLAWKIATAPYSAGESQAKGAVVGFRGAFAFQWLNPKSWLVSVAASSAYTRADASGFVQALWIGALFFAVAACCGIVWLGFGVLVRKALRSPRLQRSFNVVMGALLALSTIFVLG
jgi:threonine/homoserine/homoserine lactone efflux protein